MFALAARETRHLARGRPGMATTIFRETIESFLNCPYKGFLKLAGRQGTPPEYERVLAEVREELKRRAVGRTLDRHADNPIDTDLVLTQAALKRGPAFVLNASWEEDDIALTFDGLKRVPGRSSLGKFHYVPVLFAPTRQVRQRQRALLEVFALALSKVQGRMAGYGIVVKGCGVQATQIRLSPNPAGATRLLDEIRKLRDAGTPPRLVLNRHCQECEFRRECRAAAVEKDDLSLLGGLSRKVIAEQQSKGIFTVTQFSYTFQPGRMKRIVEARGRRHDPALQALAIREGTVYVTQKQAIPDAKVRVYLDVEGLPEPDRYYLIGLLIVDGEFTRRLSFWADQPADEAAIWASCLNAFAGLGEEFVLYHYGHYDASFLKTMAKRHGGDAELLDRIERRRVNVLGLIHGRIFFPVHGNDLKSVAGYLGFRWSAADPSGRQAMAWRHQWEATGDDALKQQLLAYNQEDCAALGQVVEAIRSLGSDEPRGEAGPRVVSVEDIKVPRPHKFCDPDYVLPAFNGITKCSYFNYQRDRVLFRTSPAVRNANRRAQRRPRVAIKVNQTIEYGAPERCPRCGFSVFYLRGRRNRLITDLKVIGGGLKRWVTRHFARSYDCRKCGGHWIPEDLPYRDHRGGRPHKYGPLLYGWVAYATVVLRLTTEATADALADQFSIVITRGEVSKLRSQAAERFRSSYESLVAKLRAGYLVHVDETWAKIKRSAKRSYVWVFATPDTAAYVYSATREGETIRTVLNGFNGVLVSDFYAAYDGMDCPQQKCLVHLARDLNDDLVKRPFDAELKQLAGEFATLMQAIVGTIDRYGLKRVHLHKHKRDVDRFYGQLETAAYASETTRQFGQRFLKYRDKLFTFLDHDGVPWNNNNAENAVKRFVSRRKVLGGTSAFTEGGFRDYLLLLSIYQTLRYRGLSFWQFLVSGETDVEAFSARHR
jgi:predicted RecB family nuclease